MNFLTSENLLIFRATRFIQSQRGTFKREFGPIWKNEDIFLKLNDLREHVVKMSQIVP